MPVSLLRLTEQPVSNYNTQGISRAAQYTVAVVPGIVAVLYESATYLLSCICPHPPWHAIAPCSESRYVAGLRTARSSKTFISDRRRLRRQSADLRANRPLL